MLLTSCFHVALGARRVCVAAVREEDPRLGTVPMVEGRLLGQDGTRELCRFGTGVEA